MDTKRQPHTIRPQRPHGSPSHIPQQVVPRTTPHSMQSRLLPRRANSTRHATRQGVLVQPKRRHAIRRLHNRSTLNHPHTDPHTRLRTQGVAGTQFNPTYLMSELGQNKPIRLTTSGYYHQPLNHPCFYLWGYWQVLLLSFWCKPNGFVLVTLRKQLELVVVVCATFGLLQSNLG